MATNVPKVTLNNGVEMPILGFGVYQIPRGHRAGRRHGSRGRAPAHRHRRLLRERGGGRPGGEQRDPPRRAVHHDQAVDPEPRRGERRRPPSRGPRAPRSRPRRPLPDPPAARRLLQLLASDGAAPRRRPRPGDRRLQLLPRPARRPHRAQRGDPGGRPDRDQPVLPAPCRPGGHAYPRRADRVLGGFAEGRNNLFTDPTLTAIGDAYGKSVAQVVLRWLIQRTSSIIPKSVRRERMEQNLDVLDFTLTDDEMARIATLDTGASLLRPPRPRPWSAGSTVDETPARRRNGLGAD